jgi:hypothetical protein
MGYRSLAVKASALLLLGFSLSACSVKGNIDDVAQEVRRYTLGQQTGLTSGSQQNTVVNGYRVSSSVGDMATNVQQQVNGYTVYGSVQGNINAETFDTTYQ